MIKYYMVQWKSKVNGRSGRGTKHFEKEEAERLVEELNREYPQIEHEVRELEPASAEKQPALKKLLC
jgi:hypothetical protein